MEMWKNKIKRRSNVEVEKFEDCTKVSIDKDTDKSKLKKIVDDHLLDTLDSTLNHGEYYYYKFGDGSALYVLLNNITKMFFNKNGEVSSLTINDASAYYIFSYKGKYVDSYSPKEDREDAYPQLLKFILEYGNVVGSIFLDELPYHAITSRIYIPSAFIRVIEEDGIALARINRPVWYEESFSYFIIDKKINAIVGRISMNLNKKGEDNFEYSGNVSYEVYLGYRHKGYATKALCLLKEYTGYLDDSYNKDLYISTVVNNVYSQQTALKSGAKLYMDTDVPKGDALRFIEKVDHVLIYKL